MAQILGQKSPFGGLCNCLRQKWGHATCQQEMRKKENTTLFKRAKKPYQQDKQGYAEVLGLYLPEYICRASRVELNGRGCNYFLQ